MNNLANQLSNNFCDYLQQPPMKYQMTETNADKQQTIPIRVTAVIQLHSLQFLVVYQSDCGHCGKIDRVTMKMMSLK